MAGGDADEARRTRRGPKPSMKALEQQKTKEIGGWSDSDEGPVEDTIEAQLSILNAPRKSLPRTFKGGTKASVTTRDDILPKILSALIELKSDKEEMKRYTRELVEELADVKMQLEEMRDQLAETNEQLAMTKTQLAKTTSAMSNEPCGASPAQSYAAALAGPARSSPTPMANSLYCTIDTSRVEGNEHEIQPGAIRSAVEREMRVSADHERWRCMAVNRDPKNSARIRIACRNEIELQQVKEAAQKTGVRGVRVLRDQLYPVKIDNANRSAVIDREGNVLPRAVETFGMENDVKIAKMAWLSRKDQAKAYGSMVVYVTSAHDASRLLQGHYFHVAGESAYTNAFEPRMRPKQCYKCQELGHMAFSCQKVQVCAKCAQKGHHHSNCQAAIPKCALCDGPHESWSKNCRVLYPNHHE
jgi:hypothetical protein